MLSNKKLHFLEMAAKISLIFLFVFFLWYEIFYKKNSTLLWQAFQVQLSESEPLWLATAFLLMPINWLLEALKWRRLADVFEHFSLGLAYKAVLAGAAIGVFTPNRIGEYGGRLLFTPKEKSIETVIATLLGSFSQLLALVGGGIIGLFVFLNLFFPSFQIFYCLGLLIALLAYGIVLFFFYNIDLLLDIFKRIYHFFKKKITPTLVKKSFFQMILKIIKNWLKHVKVLKNFTNQQLSEALFWAFLRYIIYSVQYFCVLKFMGIEVGLLESFACIATIFFLQTCVPLPPVTGLFARGGAAVYIWSFVKANEIAILTTTFSLWIVNIIIPASVGLIFILRKNYFTNDDEKSPIENPSPF
jgi:Lysylphosphatidylglycerol synthase TM region